MTEDQSESAFDVDRDRLQAELADSLQYLEHVRQELAVRREAVRSNQAEISALETKLGRISVQSGVRGGNVQSLQSRDSYRKELKRLLRRLQEKQIQLLEDVNRAVEREKCVVEELSEINEQLLALE